MQKIINIMKVVMKGLRPLALSVFLEGLPPVEVVRK